MPIKLKDNFYVRHVRARPRLFISAAVGLLTGLLIPPAFAADTITRWLIGWNAGVCLYLLLDGIIIIRSTHEQIRRRARTQDEGQSVILILVAIASFASLAAIFGELAVAKNMQGTLKYAHIGLAAFTIISSWAFTHVMFALHYAHYYCAARIDGRPAGLEFPGDETPDYRDFLYVACVIGTSGQTADVNFSSKAMRRIGLLHCVLAFFFNTTVLALMINIAASLF